MIVKLLNEHRLEFLSLTGGCRGSSEPTLVKLSNCWKYHATAHVFFQILISILLNWLLCGILTYAGVFKNDPTNVEYRSRTDARLDVIIDSPWLNFPYPGQCLLF